MNNVAEKKLQILFVGNSYTYYNRMPHEAFMEAAKEAGCAVEVTEVTHGGYKLCWFADPENEEGKRLRGTVAGRHFDYAVLQEQSCNPVKDEEEFFAGVAGVKGLIDADRFVLYATWGRNDGSPELEALGLTRQEMAEKLNEAYHEAGKRWGMAVAEVGKAFLCYPDKDALYDPDKSHPSIIGSRLAAQVIFRKIAELERE